MKTLNGTGVAMVTPFSEDGSLDLKALARLTEHLVEGGVEYLVPLGTTGESVTLSEDEKRAVLKQVISVNKGRLPVVLGHGGNNTAELVSKLKKEYLEGVDAILSVSPYYNKPSQQGIYEHYKTIATASPVPVILYNVPGRTASNMLPETSLRLASDFKNIIAIKEASGNLEQMMEIIRQKPAGFEVISGDDNLTLPLLAAGGKGVISGVANVFPKKYSDMVRYCLSGDFEHARKLHYELFEFTNLLFKEGNPAGVKAGLSTLGYCFDILRSPLAPVSENLRKLMLHFTGSQITH